MDKKQIFRAVMDAIKVGDCEGLRLVFDYEQDALEMHTPFGAWLHVAASNGHLEVVRLLVEEYKMDVNVRNQHNGRGPLDSAASKGKYEVAKYLLDHGADPDTSESFGNPLISAIKEGNVEIAKLLIERGIDTKVCYGDNGMGAAGYARSYGAAEIFELITGNKLVAAPPPTSLRELSYESLLDVATAEGITAFRLAIESNPNETFYAFGFETDNSVSGVSPLANTVEAMYRKERFADDEMYYRWAPAEWLVPIGTRGLSNLMPETNRLLTRMGEANPEESTEEFIERKKHTLQILNQALLNVRGTGMFRDCSKKSKIAFWCNIADAGGREIQWMLEPVLKYLDPEDRDEIKDFFEL